MITNENHMHDHAFYSPEDQQDLSKIRQYAYNIDPEDNLKTALQADCIKLTRKFSYRNKSKGNNKIRNAFISQAMAGSYADAGNFYPNYKSSISSLPAADTVKATYIGNQNILFTWLDNSTCKNAANNDKVFLVIYFPKIKRLEYIMHVATRKSCKALLQINAMKDQIIETWLGFVSSDEKIAGASMYAGSISF